MEALHEYNKQSTRGNNKPKRYFGPLEYHKVKLNLLQF